MERALWQANDDLKASKPAEEISQTFVNTIAKSLSQRKGVIACVPPASTSRNSANASLLAAPHATTPFL